MTSQPSRTHAAGHRRRSAAGLALSALAAAALASVSPAQPPAATAPDLALPTGTTTLTASASAGLRLAAQPIAGSEPIDIAVWYPTGAAARPATLGPYTADVALNATPLTGKRPLIIASHGTGGQRLNHLEIAGGLARAGYLVVALTHPGDNYQDSAYAGTARLFSERPRQVSLLLDALLASPDWSPLIDARRIGFYGHSAGGYTGLALLGATPSIAAILRHCAANYDADANFCPSGGKARAVESARNADRIPALPNRADARIRAAALTAPLAAAFTAEALASIRAPLRLYVPEADTILAPAFHGRFAAAQVPGAELVNVPGAGHFAPNTKIALTGVTYRGVNLNDDPAGFDRAAWIAATTREMALWFDRMMK